MGTLVVGDPRGVLHLDAGRIHNQRTRDVRHEVAHVVSEFADRRVGLCRSAA
jgi:hypothetical protein